MNAAQRFRKRPLDGDLVDAVLFDGGLHLDFLREDEQVRAAGDGSGSGSGSGAIVIETRNKTPKATIDVGDWILRHHNGAVSSCKPDVFEATYEPLGPADA